MYLNDLTIYLSILSMNLSDLSIFLKIALILHNIHYICILCNCNQPQVVDPALVEDVERQARRLATDIDNVIENLACILQSISAITVETVETYR